MKVEPNVSLPEIGGYTSPEIFVKEKSKRFNYRISHAQPRFPAFFPWTSIAYFCYKKDQKFKFKFKRSINCRRAQKCSPISIENIDILRISSKSKYFTIRFSIVMKMFLRIHFISACGGNWLTFLIRIYTSGLFYSKSMLWKFIGKMPETSYAREKSVY